MSTVYLGIGSNLGDREKNINDAIEILKEKCDIISISDYIITDPVGYLEQGKFLNGALVVKTMLTPYELLDFIHYIEKKLKRVKTIVNGPRTIDIDILLYDDIIINNEDLIIPHPRMHERSFVLEPLSHISPQALHPVINKSISEIWRNYNILVDNH